MLECTTLEVPLDYASGGGPTLDIAVARLPALDRERRVGSLVFNFGGPGVPGIRILRLAAGFVDARLRERFDLVAFDPRGTGESTAVTCAADLETYLRADPTPDSAAELAEYAALDKALAETCRRLDGPLLPHLGTVNAARDLERIRQAVGDDGLTYLGYSYGTRLGAVYAALFPGRVRALVLDGGVHPGEDWRLRAREQSAAAEAALTRFFEFCREGCALAPDPAAAWDRLERRLEAGEGGGGVTVGDLFVASSVALTGGRTGWDALDGALADLDAGSADALLQLARVVWGSGRELAAANAIACADDPARPSVEEVARAAAELAREFPRLGTAGACPRDWPAAAEPLPALRGVSAPPLVVVGTRHDPRTPYGWSVALADALQSAVLLTYEGDGHTASLQGRACVDDAVIRYLVELEPPADGTVCPA